MTANEKQICHLMSRALRVMTAQDAAEADGDEELVRCLDAALGRLAEEAKRLTARVAEPAGHDMGDVDRVVSALMPPEVFTAMIHRETDEGMTIASAESAWYVAHAEKYRAELMMDGAETLLEMQTDIKAKAYHIHSMRDYGHALLSMAEAELDLHLAAMTPKMAAELEARLEFLELLEG